MLVCWSGCTRSMDSVEMNCYMDDEISQGSVALQKFPALSQQKHSFSCLTQHLIRRFKSLYTNNP